MTCGGCKLPQPRRRWRNAVYVCPEVSPELDARVLVQLCLERLALGAVAVSLVGRHAKNHPQQVAKSGARDDVDDRWTPLHLWIPWNDRWNFTLDAAASHENHLCDRYFTLEEDGLQQTWANERVWCNPPYSAMRSWVDKAWFEISLSCPLVVMLAPANRTEQRWWQEAIEPHRDLKRPHAGVQLTTEFLPRRINFGSRDNLGAWSASSAPFGCVLLIWQWGKR